MAPGWPARLRDGELLLRPLSHRDARAWAQVRHRNAAWLSRWDATVPPQARGEAEGFHRTVTRLRAAARSGTSLPFVVEVDGRFAGQVTVSNVVRGSAQFGSLGYWIDQELAGRGLMPRAVALVIDHCFSTVRLHRLEIAIRPENTNSLRVVEKLGIREVGFAPAYLHIDGQWRDHRIFAITVEECPRGLLPRLTQQSRE